MSHSRLIAGLSGSGLVGALGRPIRAGLLGLFLGLVPGSGTAGRADRTTDDRAGRSGDRATDEGAGGGATEGTGTGPASSSPSAASPATAPATAPIAPPTTAPGGSTDGHADSGATEGTGSGAQGFGAAFLVLGRRAVAGHAAAFVQKVVIVRMIMRGRRSSWSTGGLLGFGLLPAGRR